MQLKRMQTAACARAVQDQQDSSRLGQYSGSCAISSDMLFGRESAASGKSATGSAARGGGGSRLGQLRDLASGLVSKLQDRYS